MGKSLTARGGQSPVEPAVFAKPIIFGPHMGNFAEITTKFLSNYAAIQVADEIELQEAFELLITNQSKRNAMGKAAQQVIQENKGATEQTISMILKGI